MRIDLQFVSMCLDALVAHPNTIVFEVLCNGSRPSEGVMSTLAIAATTDRTDPPLVLQRGSSTIAVTLMCTLAPSFSKAAGRFFAIFRGQGDLSKNMELSTRRSKP